MAGSRRGDGASVALLGLGCRVSRSDLDALASTLRTPFALCEKGEGADYVVVYTCTVTADADAATRQAIRRAAREHPGAAIVVAGCYAEVRPEELRNLPGVAAVVGRGTAGDLEEILLSLHARRGAATAPPPKVRSPAPGRAPLPFHHTRAFLKVEDGCDAACAYCIIPRARGPARSLPFEEALGHVETLGRESPEVVLSGVHLGAYGRDLVPPRSLQDLVTAVERRDLCRRLRLSSIEPLEVPLALFERPMAGALCEHLHLPLQSGSDPVLAAMRRPYLARDYAYTVERVARSVAGICLGADVIAGFPGETEGDHRATLALLEGLPVAYLHVFPFSARPGTAAAQMPHQVPAAIARERAGELRAFSRNRWRAFSAAHVGREVEVVVERVRGGYATGTARTYLSVRWRAAGERRGELARVRVEAVAEDVCLGTRVPCG